MGRSRSSSLKLETERIYKTSTMYWKNHKSACSWENSVGRENAKKRKKSIEIKSTGEFNRHG